MTHFELCLGQNVCSPNLDRLQIQGHAAGLTSPEFSTLTPFRLYLLLMQLGILDTMLKILPSPKRPAP